MAAASATAGAAADDTTVIVGAGSPQEAQAVAAELRAEGMSVTAIPQIGALRVVGEDLPEVRALIGTDPRVDWIEPPRERTLFVIAPPTYDELTGREYGWGVQSVDGAESVSQVPGVLPVKVAVIDSGIDVGHADLAGRIGPTYDVLTGGTGVRDFVGHGTFVAGLISAIDDNGLGGRGVAGATVVLPIRITTTGTIKSTDAANGILRAVDSGAGVINLSFGGGVLSSVEKAALAYAAEKDVLVVAAAGNNYLLGQRRSSTPRRPSGASRADGARASAWRRATPSGGTRRFSTANDFVSVAAPGAGAGDCGDGVFSTIPANLTTLWDGDDNSSCTRVVDALEHQHRALRLRRGHELRRAPGGRRRGPRARRQPRADRRADRRRHPPLGQADDRHRLEPLHRRRGAGRRQGRVASRAPTTPRPRCRPSP